MSLRIAMTSYYLPSESKIGVGYQVHALANALVDRGHTVDVHSACPASVGARYSTVHHEITGSMRTFRFASRVRSVDWTAYDVLHAHGDDYWLWTPGSHPPRAHVRTLHGSCFDEALRIHGVIQRTRMVALGFSEVAASLVADRTVVVSPGTLRWYPWVKQVIPNGVALGTFHPALDGVRSPDPAVLFVGTWNGRKRGAELARQFSVVRERWPKAELWMVSRDVPDDAPAGVRAFGAVDEATLADLYRRAWAFCLPSSYEGFGIPYVEAMASGLPVVATDNPGSAYVTRDGRDGLIVEVDDLGTTLRDLLGADTERARLATAGLARARDFSLASVVDEYLKLYEAAGQHG